MLAAADQDVDMNGENLPLSSGAGRPPSPSPASSSASAAATRPQQLSMAPQHASVPPGAVTPASPGPEMGYQIVGVPVGGELQFYIVGPMEKPQSSRAVVPGPIAATTDDDGPGSSRGNQALRMVRALAESTRAAADLKAATEWLCPIISDVLEKKAPPSSPPVSQDPAYRILGEENREEMEAETEDPFARSARRIREVVESELAAYEKASERASQAFEEVCQRGVDTGEIQLNTGEPHPSVLELVRQIRGTK